MPRSKFRRKPKASRHRFLGKDTTTISDNQAPFQSKKFSLFLQQKGPQLRGNDPPNEPINFGRSDPSKLMLNTGTKHTQPHRPPNKRQQSDPTPTKHRRIRVKKKKAPNEEIKPHESFRKTEGRISKAISHPRELLSKTKGSKWKDAGQPRDTLTKRENHSRAKSKSSNATNSLNVTNVQSKTNISTNIQSIIDNKTNNRYKSFSSTENQSKTNRNTNYQLKTNETRHATETINESPELRKKTKCVQEQIASIKLRTGLVQLQEQHEPVERNTATRNSSSLDEDAQQKIKDELRDTRIRQEEWIKRVFHESHDRLVGSQAVPKGLQPSDKLEAQLSAEALEGDDSKAERKQEVNLNATSILFPDSDDDDDDIGFDSNDAGNDDDRRESGTEKPGIGLWIQSTKEIINIPDTESTLQSIFQLNVKDVLQKTGIKEGNSRKKKSKRRKSNTLDVSSLEQKSGTSTRNNIGSIVAEEHQFLKTSNTKALAAILKLRTIAVKASNKRQKGVISLGNSSWDARPPQTAVGARPTFGQDSEKTDKKLARVAEESRSSITVLERQEAAVGALEELVAKAKARYPHLRQKLLDTTREVARRQRHAKGLSLRHAGLLDELGRAKLARQAIADQREAGRTEGRVLETKAASWGRLLERTTRQVLLLRARRAGVAKSLKVHEDHEEEIVGHYRAVAGDREAAIFRANGAVRALEAHGKRRAEVMQRQQSVLTHSNALVHYFEAHEEHRQELRSKVRSKVPSRVIQLQKSLERRNIANITTMLQGSVHGADQPVQYRLGDRQYGEAEIFSALDGVRDQCGLAIGSPNELVSACQSLVQDEKALNARIAHEQEAMKEMKAVHSGLQDQLQEIEMEFGSYEYVMRRGAFDQFQKQVMEKAQQQHELREKIRLRTRSLLRIQCAIDLFCSRLYEVGTKSGFLGNQVSEQAARLRQLRLDAVSHTVQQLVASEMDSDNSRKNPDIGAASDNDDPSCPKTAQQGNQTNAIGLSSPMSGPKHFARTKREDSKGYLENPGMMTVPGGVQTTMALELLKRINDPNDDRHAFNTVDELQFFQKKLEFLGTFCDTLLARVSAKENERRKKLMHENTTDDFSSPIGSSSMKIRRITNVLGQTTKLVLPLEKAKEERQQSPKRLSLTNANQLHGFKNGDITAENARGNRRVGMMRQASDSSTRYSGSSRGSSFGIVGEVNKARLAGASMNPQKLADAINKFDTGHPLIAIQGSNVRVMTKQESREIRAYVSDDETSES